MFERTLPLQPDPFEKPGTFELNFNNSLAWNPANCNNAGEMDNSRNGVHSNDLECPMDWCSVGSIDGNNLGFDWSDWTTEVNQGTMGEDMLDAMTPPTTLMNQGESLGQAIMASQVVGPFVPRLQEAPAELTNPMASSPAVQVTAGKLKDLEWVSSAALTATWPSIPSPSTSNPVEPSALNLNASPPLPPASPILLPPNELQTNISTRTVNLGRPIVYVDSTYSRAAEHLNFLRGLDPHIPILRVHGEQRATACGNCSERRVQCASIDYVVTGTKRPTACGRCYDLGLACAPPPQLLKWKYIEGFRFSDVN